MATLAEFKASFPEFRSAPDALVTLKMTDAAESTSVAVWGATYDKGIYYRTADLLAKSPFGRKMGLVNKDGTTAYSADLRRLEELVTVGYRTS